MRLEPGECLLSGLNLFWGYFTPRGRRAKPSAWGQHPVALGHPPTPLSTDHRRQRVRTTATALVRTTASEVATLGLPLGGVSETLGWPRPMRSLEETLSLFALVTSVSK